MKSIVSRTLTWKRPNRNMHCDDLLQPVADSKNVGLKREGCQSCKAASNFSGEVEAAPFREHLIAQHPMCAGWQSGMKRLQQAFQCPASFVLMALPGLKSSESLPLHLCRNSATSICRIQTSKWQELLGQPLQLLLPRNCTSTGQ